MCWVVVVGLKGTLVFRFEPKSSWYLRLAQAKQYHPKQATSYSFSIPQLKPHLTSSLLKYGDSIFPFVGCSGQCVLFPTTYYILILVDGA